MFYFFLFMKIFNVFNLPQKLKDWGELGIQEYEKCQGLFIFSATRDESLKEKSLKYCMSFFGQGVRLDFNTSLKIIQPQKRAAKHNISSIKKGSHKNIPKFPYRNILLYEHWKLKMKVLTSLHSISLITFSFGWCTAYYILILHPNKLFKTNYCRKSLI